MRCFNDCILSLSHISDSPVSDDQRDKVIVASVGHCHSGTLVYRRSKVSRTVELNLRNTTLVDLVDAVDAVDKWILSLKIARKHVTHCANWRNFSTKAIHRKELVAVIVLNNRANGIDCIFIMIWLYIDLYRILAIYYSYKRGMLSVINP